VDDFLSGLSENALLALPWLFEFWALPHQVPPRGAWKTWVILGGRGAGKTRAGAEWVRAEVEGAGRLDPGRSRRVALVGETLDQVREVMIMGESGILACSPPDRRPEWQATRQQLVWPNGAVAQVFSAHDPERLRGPQFDAAWADELGKWKKGAEAWDQLQFALRLGKAPRTVVTTTPRNVAVLKAILKNPSTVTTHAPTEANRAYLAESFLAEVEARYGGTRLGRQELDGVLLEDAEGALWTTAMLEAAREAVVPQVTRIVVAVDPPVTATKKSDACGIVVVGADTRGDPRTWRAVVLEDASVTGASPEGWARAALAAMARHGADRLVSSPAPGDQLIGIGDGATTVFRLAKTYTSGAQSHVRPIQKPVAGTVLVAVADDPKVAGLEFDIDTETGEVTFAVAPDLGTRITAGFEFDVPVRFDTDSIQTSVASFQAGDVPNVPVVEIRL